MNSVFQNLLRDKTAWIGSVSSFIATMSAKIATVKFPDSLEGWSAFCLTAVTIVYIVTKTYVIIKDRRKIADTEL